MKFAIPIAEGKLTAHFGHCQEFAIIDVEDNQIMKKETLAPPPHPSSVRHRDLDQASRRDGYASSLDGAW